MITVHLMGGLGNQMFQIFSALATSLRNERPFVVLSKYMKNFNGREDRPTYWDTIFAGLCKHIQFAVSIPDIYQIREHTFHYTPIITGPILVGRNIMLNGYYQSEKYFKDQFDHIYHICKFQQMSNKVLMKYCVKNNNHSQNVMENTISMHFRIGDYKKLTHIHPIMSYDYYRNSLIHIFNNLDSSNYKVFYFCEDEDLDFVMTIVDKLLQEFGSRCVFERADPSYTDWEQMLFMSCCSHHIIANSSFSWWGAYLNRNPTKLVCYPSVWFGPQVSHNTYDLCPPEWIRISV
jgi:hypothetical protein